MRRLAFEVISQSGTMSTQSKQLERKRENKLGLSCAKLKSRLG
jgi:hypothetical protein